MKKWLALLLVLMLGASLLQGCKKEEAGTETETTEGSSETQESTSADASSDEPSSEEEVITFGPEDYSYGLLDNGFMDGVTALEHIDVPDFSEVKLDGSGIEPNPEEIESQVTGFLSMFASQNTERAIESGDRVNIDYSGSMDGVVFDGGTAQDQMVTAGTNDFIDDFLYQIIGHKPGETMDVEVTFPDPYQNNPDFAGKDAVFVVTINYISETPELTDGWVQENLDTIQQYFGTSKIDSAEGLRTFIHDYFYDMNVEEVLYRYLTENIKAKEIPEAVYNISRKMTDISLYNSYGVLADEFVEMGGATEEELEEALNADATMFLLYQAIAEKEGWESVTEADFSEVTGSEDNQKVIDQFGKGYIAKYVLYSRAEDYIKGKVQLENTEK